MAFVQRKLSFTIALGTGAFGDDGANTLTVSGVRASAHIRVSGGELMGEGQFRIRGLTASQMNQLSCVSRKADAQRNNSITVSAGDSLKGMSVVFRGTIADAWADLNGAPDVVFNINGLIGLYDAVKQVPATSYPGQVDAAVVLANLAGQMGIGFENNGVSVMLSTPYHASTLREQLLACVEAAHVDWVISPTRNLLAIWPKGGSRKGEIQTISPASGLVGYPRYTSQGLALKTLFNPNIEHGYLVEVQSSVVSACGQWLVSSVAHNLDAETPNGQWFTEIQAESITP